MGGVDEAIKKVVGAGIKDGVSSGSSSLIQTIFSPIIFIFSKVGWRLGITIILLFFVLIGAISQSISQKSALPIFYEIGGRLVSADEMIYQKVTNLENNPQLVIYNKENGNWFDSIKTFFSKILFWADVIISFWFIYMNFYLINKLIEVMHGKTFPPYINWVWTIFVLFTLQMIFSQSLFTASLIKNELNATIPNLNKEQAMQMKDTEVMKIVLARCVPFKGVISLGIYGFNKISNLASSSIVTENTPALQ